MSHRATVWAIEQKLPALAKLVLIILADRHNNDSNRCDPSMERVAEDCGMSRDSVRRQIKVLVERKLITVHQRKNGMVNLTNFFSFNMQQIPPPPSNSTHPLPANSTPNQEVLNQEEKITTLVPPAAGDDQVSPSPETKTTHAAIGRLFAAFLVGTDRSPRMYTLTPRRMTVGLARLEDCRKKCGDLEKAEAMMGLAIEALLQSKFHMGDNEQKKQYTDWIDNLFKSTEKLEWWLARYEE